MIPPLYVVLAIIYSHGTFQAAEIDHDVPFATLERCSQFITTLAEHALTDDGKSVVWKCLPVPSRNDHDRT